MELHANTMHKQKTLKTSMQPQSVRGHQPAPVGGLVRAGAEEGGRGVGWGGGGRAMLVASWPPLCDSRMGIKL